MRNKIFIRLGCWKLWQHSETARENEANSGEGRVRKSRKIPWGWDSYICRRVLSKCIFYLTTLP
jgi:hypothetical protein